MYKRINSFQESNGKFSGLVRTSHRELAQISGFITDTDLETHERLRNDSGIARICGTCPEKYNSNFSEV
jgi:hypothetical protein